MVAPVILAPIGLKVAATSAAVVHAVSIAVLTKIVGGGLALLLCKNGYVLVKLASQVNLRIICAAQNVLAMVNSLMDNFDKSTKAFVEYTNRMYDTLPLMGIQLRHGTEVVVHTIHREVERAGRKILLIFTLFIDGTSRGNARAGGHREEPIELFGPEDNMPRSGINAVAGRPIRTPKPFRLHEAPLVTVVGVDSETRKQVSPETIGSFDSEWIRPELGELGLESGLRCRKAMCPLVVGWNDD